MNIYIKLKSAGKRRYVLENTPYTLPDGISSLRQLIETIVRQEVDTYNKRVAENAQESSDAPSLVNFLTETEIADKSTVGKIGFGRLYSDKKADPYKAVETALQGFEDGLFRFIMWEKEVKELDEPFFIQENDTLTFIRLTFLAGRLW